MVGLVWRLSSWKKETWSEYDGSGGGRIRERSRSALVLRYWLARLGMSVALKMHQLVILFDNVLFARSLFL